MTGIVEISGVEAAAGGGSGSGTVTNVSVVSANGFAGSVANATTTPAITISTTITGILSGDGTAISAASTTGSGAVVLATSPTLTTPALGTPSAIVLTSGTGLPVSTGISGLGTGVAAALGNTAGGAGGFALVGTTPPTGSAGGDLTGTYPNPTLAAIVTAGGPTGSATVAPIIIYDAKGRLTAVSSATITPAVGSITGLGTGVATALGVNVGSAGAFVTFNGAGGTPSSMTATNLTGTASGLTAGNVTTNANLTGVITSSGNATSIASQTGTGTKFVVDTGPTIVGMTNSSNGAASTAAELFSGTIFTGGSATTNFPQIFVQPTGTSAVTSWSTSGTVFGANAVSGFGGNFIDFRVAGSATKFTVDSGGSVTGAGNIDFNGGRMQVGNTASYNFNSRTIIKSPADGALSFNNNASSIVENISFPVSNTLQFGLADAAVAVAQILRVQSVVAGTAAANGANWTLIGSLPTGTGTSGDIIIQTGVKTGSGTTQGTPTTALTIKGETQAVTIASGKSLVLGNAATTGLTPGVLAASTNSSIVITDSAGQAYRIPCII